MLRSSPLRLVACFVAAGFLACLTFVAGPAVSDAARGPVKTIAREVHTSVVHQRDVTLPISASHVVLHWAGNPHAVLTVAFAGADGAFGEATQVELDDDVPDDGPAASSPSDESFSQVLVAEGATALRVTTDRPINHLTVVALDTRGSALQAAADAVVAATGVGTANAAEGQPVVISRAAWGANEAYRFDSGGHEKWPRTYNPMQKLIVHHTAGKNNDPNPAATIRAIYYDHAILRGHGDIGYNFLVDAQGRVFEGRYSRPYGAGEGVTGEDLAGDPVRGGHAGGYNAGTVGIALLGNFQTVQPPAAQRTGLIRLLAWEAERHGVNPLGSGTYVNPETGISLFLNNISGHRNVNPTACPGDAFYPTFPTLRQQVANEIAAHSGASVDHTAPTGTLSPMLTPTGGSTMTFGLPFTEPVTDLTADDFAVTGTSAGWAVTDVTGTASTYTITVHSDAPTDGTVVLTLAAGSVTDLAGNTGPPDPLEATADFATDTTEPSVVLWWTPHRSSLNAKTFDLTATFSEPVVGLTLDDVVVGGTSNAFTPWTFVQPAMLGAGANYGFSLEAVNPASGTVTVTIPAGATTDPAGNPNAEATISVLIDRALPTTTTPTAGLRAGTTFNGSPVAVRVSWVGSDTGGSGLTTYDVERSVDGAAFAVIATGVGAQSIDVGLTLGHTYRYAVRAHDAAGNVGAWRAGSTMSTIVRQNTSGYVGYSGTWHTASYASFSGGSVRYATAAGAAAKLAFTGRSIAVVSTLAANRGQVKIYLDGVFVATVDTHAASTAYRRVIWSRTFATSGSHTIRLVVVGTAGRPRFDLDAFLVLK
ncbi:MAG TPA: N-acetylmuramoyl-L-alanine amidase [Candidatus Acidoferrales bacterium]|nr:N-acetylmuramoyl-L-alanine amidase [Candidatus Acidoferrales bacterium]